MKKDGIPPGDTFSNNNTVGFVDEINFDIVIIVDDVARCRNHHSGNRKKKKFEITKNKCPLLHQEEGSEILSKGNNEQIPDPREADKRNHKFV